MKKIISVLLSAVMISAIAVTAAGCNSTDRSQILKLYMPGEYIDEDIFETFESWYEEQTGEKVTVKIETFDAVEDIQMAVEASKADYDILCPSDYMVEYLAAKGLLKEVDKSLIDIEKDELIKAEYVATTREFDSQLKYAVPYMYGTLGIAYDMRKTGRVIDSWEALFGNEFAGKRSLKKSIHDAYAAACLYNAGSETKALSGTDKKQKIQSIFEDTSAATIDGAKTALANVKRSAVWDVDNVKFEMAADQSDVAVALMWSCDAGYVMNDYEDEDGNEQKGNRNLWYCVPEEGGNVYIDAFVISKYAVNEKAANYFLKFVCQKDIAVKNSEYAGAISPVKAAYDELYAAYDEDEDGMFDGTPDGWKEMFIETMFPSAETLERCGVMKDFGDAKSALTKMWGDIIA